MDILQDQIDQQYEEKPLERSSRCLDQVYNTKQYKKQILNT